MPDGAAMQNRLYESGRDGAGDGDPVGKKGFVFTRVEENLYFGLKLRPRSSLRLGQQQVVPKHGPWVSGPHGRRAMEDSQKSGWTQREI